MGQLINWLIGHFVDCLFRICPVYRYAAQKQHWAEQKKARLGETVDEEMLEKLKVAAEKEREQNEMEYRKVLGSAVQVRDQNGKGQTDQWSEEEGSGSDDQIGFGRKSQWGH